MRTLKFLLRKEFRQIFRDKGLLPILFILPMIQLLIMPLAADFDVKNINVAIVDNDHSSYSQQLIEKIATEAHISKAQAETILNVTVENIKKTVKKGDDVKIVGFGPHLLVMSSLRKPKRLTILCNDLCIGPAVRIRAVPKLKAMHIARR